MADSGSDKNGQLAVDGQVTLAVDSGTTSAKDWVTETSADGSADGRVRVDGTGDLHDGQSLALALPSDPLFSSQWHLNSATGYDINVTDVWDDYTGQGVSVSVYDTGVDPNHPDLDDNYDYLNQYNTLTGTSDGAPQVSGDDEHGTAVAGLIAAERNDTGVVGVAYGATIVPIYDPLSGTSAQIMARLVNGYAHAANFDVSNHSWGFGNNFYSTPDAAFIDNFYDPTFAAAGAALANATISGRGGLGTVFVQSAGNTREYGDDVNLHNFQNSRYTVTVGASQENGKITDYSTGGAAVLVTAPGSPATGTITTTDRLGGEGYSSGDYTSSFNGTSAAAPIVSGVVALMLEANPTLGWRDVQEILVYSARNSDPTSSSWQTNGAGNWNGGGLEVSHLYGAGLVDAHAAVRLAETWQTQRTSANEQFVGGTNGTDMSIPDQGGYNSFAISTINIGSGVEIDHIEVDLYITHTWIGDLRVILVSPDGTESVLMDRPGLSPFDGLSSSQNDVFFTFSSTQHWGETGAGTWTLMVQDHGQFDQGVLRDWSLRLYGDEIGSDDTYIYTDAFGGYTADAQRQSLVDGGGTDTINAAAVTTDSTIDLNDGADSTIAGNALSIASGTLIENAFAGDGNDTITGNALANEIRGGRGDDMLEGGGGADILDGGDGIDLAVYDTSDTAVSVDLQAGTITGGDAQNDTLINIEGIGGSAFGDTIYGNAASNVLNGYDGVDVLDGRDGNDTIRGGDGNDGVIGSGGDDTLYGDAGDDSLGGGAGADILDGGTGTDWANYGASDAGVSVDLQSGTASGGHAEGDTLTSIESLGGSAHNDTLAGNADANVLEGRQGDDVLEGRGGADTLRGAEGTDTALYDGSAAGVAVDLATGTGTGGDAEGDTLYGVENLTGSAHADTLLGNDSVNVLAGGDGNDVLDGRAGDDVLRGGAGDDGLIGFDGDDQIEGGAGDDTLGGGTGADSLDGGTGTDCANYGASDAGVSVDLASGNGTAGHALGDTLTSIENLRGSDHADTLMGDGGANALTGRAGNDVLDGRAGDDTIRGGDGNDGVIGAGGDDILHGDAGDDSLGGGAGADVLDGGTGTDRASYGASDAGVTIDLQAGTGSGGHAQGDTLISIEDVAGSAYGDTLAGSAAANVLIGGQGDDVLDGRGGADTLRGAEGTDTVLYTGSSAGVAVDLISGTGTGGDAQGDTLHGIENLTGSVHNDTLLGNDSVNLLEGGDGNDVLDGRSGDDVLRGGGGDDGLIGFDGDDRIEGGAGDDMLGGGAGADVLDGGTGNDWANYGVSDGDVFVDLVAGAGAGGHAQGDTLTDIENLGGSAHADVLSGNGGANILDGRDGDDLLYGRGGDDTLHGGAGNDVLIGDDGNDTVYGGAGNDGVVGANGNDMLYGGAGDDSLGGGAGADHLDGGSGTDWANYGVSDAGVAIDLQAGTASGGHAQGDTLTSIESVGGSNHADALSGSSVANVLEGRQGDDVLDGRGGDDRLKGGEGDDTYHFARNDGNDTIDNAGRSADGDRLLFGDTIAYDQLWFQQSGNNLLVSVVGEDGTLTVSDWFNGSGNTVSSIETAAGETLNVTGVANLVTAMAAFSPPSGPDEDMAQPVRQALAVDLAANWQTSS